MRTRNQRLSAIHAFARFIGEHAPEHLQWCAEVRQIPFKKTADRSITCLDREEIQALLEAPARATVQGARDYALLLFLYNSGARVSEAAQLSVQDIDWHARAVQVLGKGRVCCINHTRTNVLHAHMCFLYGRARQKGSFSKTLRNIYFCFAHAQRVLRKPMSPGSLRQRFTTSISSPRSVRASAFAFISRSTSA